jgi:hypothetical protein
MLFARLLGLSYIKVERTVTCFRVFLALSYENLSAKESMLLLGCWILYVPKNICTSGYGVFLSAAHYLKLKNANDMLSPRLLGLSYIKESLKQVHVVCPATYSLIAKDSNDSQTSCPRITKYFTAFNIPSLCLQHLSFLKLAYVLEHGVFMPAAVDIYKTLYD